MFPFQISLELRMTEAWWVVTTGAISHAKLQSNHHHQQTNTPTFYRPDALPVTQPTVSKHRREISSDFPWPTKFPDLLQFSIICRKPGWVKYCNGSGMTQTLETNWCHFSGKARITNRLTASPQTKNISATDVLPCWTRIGPVEWDRGGRRKTGDRGTWVSHWARNSPSCCDAAGCRATWRFRLNNNRPAALCICNGIIRVQC